MSSVSIEMQTLPVDQKKVGIINMHRAPANALNREHVEAISAALDELESNPSVIGFILTSTLTNFFSAGIDLSNFTKPIDEWCSFWLLFRTFFLRLYESPLISVAAINGHAPAGGAIMSLACQYRLMVDGKFGIGVNEPKLGLVVPRWVVDIAVQTLGLRQAERMLPLGAVVPPSTAQHVGLIDKIVSRKSDLIPAAIEQVSECAKIDAYARSTTMQFIRQNFSRKMRAEEKLDMSESRRIVASEQFQAALLQYRRALAAQASQKAEALRSKI